MPATTIDQDGHFEPLHAAHAIEQVVFVVQFASELDQAQMAQVRKAALEFKSETDLPGQMEIQEISIGFGHPAQVQAATPPAPGLLLHSTGRNGAIEQELRVERASLTYRTTKYSRWETVWGQALRYFDSLTPLYAPHSQIKGVSLNYIDKFVWNGALASCRPEQLILAGSKYVCPHVFETTEYWHSHTGKFIRISDSIRRLLNVNVDFLEEANGQNTRRVVTITSVLTDMINLPGYSPFQIEKDRYSSFIEERMRALHADEKRVLSEVIRPEMAKRIALN